MLWNAETVIVGKRCCLVPYRKEHVLTYHEWMKDHDLLDATQSEPLSLQEEYIMQQSWLLDSKKCTFIILDKDQLIQQPPSLQSQQHTSFPVVEDTNTNDTSIMVPVDPNTNFVYQNRSAMVGDVNLFFSDEDDDDHDDDHDDNNQQPPNKTTSNCDSDNDTTIQYQQAELDIMIAVKDARQKGIGTEACLLMMLYITTMTTSTIPLTFSIRRFFVKINQTNLSSIQLFTKLGFQLYQIIECFQQIEMEYKTNSISTMIQQLQTLYHQKVIILPDLKQPTNIEEKDDDDITSTTNSTLVTFHCPPVVLE